MPIVARPARSSLHTTRVAPSSSVTLSVSLIATFSGIAEARVALGIFSNHNTGRRPGFIGYPVRSAFLVMIAHGTCASGKAGLANAWTDIAKLRALASTPPTRAMLLHPREKGREGRRGSTSSHQLQPDH